MNLALTTDTIRLGKRLQNTQLYRWLSNEGRVEDECTIVIKDYSLLKRNNVYMTKLEKSRAAAIVVLTSEAPSDTTTP